MQSEAKKHLIIFILIAVIAGLGLSSFFYFLASSYKKVLNGTAIATFLAFLGRSFYLKWPRRKELLWVKKISLAVPFYFNIMNAVSFFLLLLPRLIQKPSASLAVLSAFSFLILLLWGLKKIFIQESNKKC